MKKKGSVWSFTKDLLKFKILFHLYQNKKSIMSLFKNYWFQNIIQKHWTKRIDKKNINWMNLAMDKELNK
jgi:hypothetical protein